MPHREIPPLPTETRGRARQLRAAATDAESFLWYRIRSGRLGGHKFRRQFPVPPYVADFCCVAAMLIVELDGSQHGETDIERDASLRRRGFRILRFWNNDVFERLEDVLSAILAALQDPTLTPSPAPALAPACARAFAGSSLTRLEFPAHPNGRGEPIHQGDMS